MSYTLEALASDLGQALQETSDEDRGAALCGHVEKAITDAAFRTTNLGADKTMPREVLYEDETHGFCICVHSYRAGATSPPHDHGPTWAIYGQADGETEMTDWEIVEPGDGDKPARVALTETYMLRPGMAKYYAPGAIHAPRRAGATKLLRIEGANLDHVKRTPMEPVETAAA